MLKAIEHLFEDWNEGKVRYCHWKSINQREDTMEGMTDLDILVDPYMASLAAQVLTRNGFQRLDTVPLRAYPGIMDYVCLDESGV